MVDTTLTHPTYKFVDEKEADAIAWAFVDKDNLKRVTFKFPELKPNEIRAKVLYSGLCHSDVHTVKGEWGPVKYPIAPGHEIVGEVTHVGSEVKNFKVGEKIGFGCQRERCETCEFCQMDADQFCRGGGEQNFTYGDLYWGGYASAIQHPEKFFFKLPEGLPLEQVPPLFCAGVTTHAPIARYVKPGDKVAILGIGGLGHMGVKYAKAYGAHVTGFTTSKDKEQFIKELGADRVVVTSEETLKQEAGKYHFILNTLPSNDQLNALLGLARPFGVFCQVGLPAFAAPASFNPAPLIFGQVSYVGSLIGSRPQMRETLEASGKHKIVPLCEQFDFEDFPKAFDRLVNGKPVFRVVVNATKAGPKH